MSKTYCIIQNKKLESTYGKTVYKWIDKFIENKDENDKVVTSISDVTTDDVIVVGNNLSGDVLKAVKKLVKSKKNVSVIENLCADVSYEAFRKGVEEINKLNVKIYRYFEFLNDEIDKVVRDSLKSSSGRDSNFSKEEYFINLKYDSLDLMNLVCDIEDNFYTKISKDVFGKLFKVKDIHNILNYGELTKYNLK